MKVSLLVLGQLKFEIKRSEFPKQLFTPTSPLSFCETSKTMPLLLPTSRRISRAVLFTHYFLSVCFLLVSSLYFAHAVRAQDGTDDVIDFQTNLVQLNVGVADRQGRPITNLSGNDFVIYEDDVKQTVKRAKLFTVCLTSSS